MVEKGKTPGQVAAENIVADAGKKVVKGLEKEVSTTPSTVQEELAQRVRTEKRLNVLTILANLANGIRTFFGK